MDAAMQSARAAFCGKTQLSNNCEFETPAGRGLAAPGGKVQHSCTETLSSNRIGSKGRSVGSESLPQ
ncbi:hypothetical protein CDO30_29175 (plasmid) [Sinorhizobium meliloti]|uniref:Uncharacterized protein n=1 Tax=Sinorhizobium meliloti (strain SM11) TaxID=707241 RepID=F7XGQ1_SINMM|nr:hypothetical protein SM11_pD0895 [Sinorhizobium meliloti SM11]ASP62260.1 hypothetical protein CDO30_29175 [Sinorhizobium meliloti]ASP74935.1 hypothetical protein CDO28_26265 [Sinorhizobium meliloti]ASQ14520.1 hypothetical protein CDO22_32010 [Sinorhizobium meliloti]ATA96751.1 hypothetical protein BWO76_10420 [Sinorhizobium meliloti]